MEPSQNPIRAVVGSGLEAAAAHNRRAVIDAIRVNGPLSRAALSRATRLSKQTLSNIVEHLEAAGLLVACDPVAEGRGKPSIPYDLAPMGALSLGVQIDRSVARAVVMDLRGSVVARHDAPLPGRDPEAGLAVLERLIAEARAALCAEDAGRIVGLGVAMPGPFGPDAGAVRDDYSMAGWRDVNLAERLAKATGLEVVLQNDAGAAAISEKLTGKAHGLRNAVCLYLGYGLGAGLIVNGELYGGHHCDAGEIGMIPLPGGALLEHEVALGALCDRFGIAQDRPDMWRGIETLVHSPDPEVQAWLTRASGHIAWAARMLELTLDPEAVILCGTAPRALLERLASGRIEVGHADPWLVAIGAAAEPIARNFDPRHAALLKACPTRAGKYGTS
ncbi:ROK family transcriptional regulator [Salipiger sp. 1_MG-2023]|uniref:ROK family transcriptional regulator n=1 Tax=Salipiger sp. 1_MG-2023 TaxID=3062665 RepID=UPI0026E2E12A|nr:ROK family transcriptional regulator [Salipiger sp. 1_MG-2023]MDO6587378.1 ROK family transcriptional regulator [Salipiger sp. 1_MG-2023]